ncbi:MAG: hypothetical protein KatS3mg044_1166 [Rhodothermaceae bacterium]|nr:MAG: hypothetical protein KatS3mg044_1166 [Rhodothermaceae bacterium]
METLVPYAIWAVLLLAGIGLLLIVLFGLRNLTFGKISPVSIAIVALPGLLMLGLGLGLGDWAQAGVITFLVMLLLALLSLFLSSLRGFIGL